MTTQIQSSVLSNYTNVHEGLIINTDLFNFGKAPDNPDKFYALVSKVIELYFENAQNLDIDLRVIQSYHSSVRIQIPKLMKKNKMYWVADYSTVSFILDTPRRKELVAGEKNKTWYQVEMPSVTWILTFRYGNKYSFPQFVRAIMIPFIENESGDRRAIHSFMPNVYINGHICLGSYANMNIGTDEMTMGFPKLGTWPYTVDSIADGIFNFPHRYYTSPANDDVSEMSIQMQDWLESQGINIERKYILEECYCMEDPCECEDAWILSSCKILSQLHDQRLDWSQAPIETYRLDNIFDLDAILHTRMTKKEMLKQLKTRKICDECEELNN